MKNRKTFQTILCIFCVILATACMFTANGIQKDHGKVEIIDGSYHPVDSSEMAFKIAGSMAFKEAAKKAGIELLEPIMKVELTTPDENMGDLIGDLTSRRGSIVEINSGENSFDRIVANVPLSELFGYATAIRSLSRGRASYSMEPAHFEKVPKQVQDKIVEKK